MPMSALDVYKTEKKGKEANRGRMILTPTSNQFPKVGRRSSTPLAASKSREERGSLAMEPIIVAKSLVSEVV